MFLRRVFGEISMFERINQILKNPTYYSIAAVGRLLKGTPALDEVYLKILYQYKIGKKIDFENPLTYNEKQQWMKVHYYNPLYTKLADKYEVRKYIADKIGEEYLIPLLGVYNSFDEIDFDNLPNQFVMKCTHDSGGLVICTDKSKLDKKKARAKIERCLKRNYYTNSREWVYRDIKPRIIIEKYMVDESGYELKDYKFFCFDGKAKAMFMASDRTGNEETKFDFYDMDFNHLDFTNGHPNSNKELKKPDKFEEMIVLAEKISEGFPHERVDLYNINGKLYFGEITFFHWSGLTPFKPEKWDRIFGDWFNLPEKNR
jgi:hypothetical protein